MVFSWRKTTSQCPPLPFWDKKLFSVLKTSKDFGLSVFPLYFTFKPTSSFLNSFFSFNNYIQLVTTNSHPQHPPSNVPTPLHWFNRYIFFLPSRFWQAKFYQIFCHHLTWVTIFSNLCHCFFASSPLTPKLLLPILGKTTLPIPISILVLFCTKQILRVQSIK
jgi:hypothetical protein